MPIVELLAIFAMWSPPRIWASIGQIQRRIRPQLRHQMQTHLSDPLHGIMMTQLTIKNKVHHLASVTYLLQQALDVLLAKTERWAELHVPTVAILAPWGTSPLPLGLLRWLYLRCSLTGLLHLFGHDRVRC